MQHTTRWQQLCEWVVLTLVLVIVCVPFMGAIYQFGVALGEPAVGIVLAVFVLHEIVWDVGPIMWKE
jgi:hypothetical protein